MAQKTSKKFPMLEWIFEKYNPEHETTKQIIPFTLQDISDGYKAKGIQEPASISNTILDLTRHKRTIDHRLPESIYTLGYDLRKKTGKVLEEEGANYAGEFVYVGVGNELNQWLIWDKFDESFSISPSNIPSQILPFLRQDEGALFSVIDYCDILSSIFHNSPHSIIRVQNPLKWQPNEIDGFYHGTWNDGNVLYPIEAKALSTKDDVNLTQMLGEIQTLSDNLSHFDIYLQPIAARMIHNGIDFAIFQKIKPSDKLEEMSVIKKVEINFNPELEPWK